MLIIISPRFLLSPNYAFVLISVRGMSCREQFECNEILRNHLGPCFLHTFRGSKEYELVETLIQYTTFPKSLFVLDCTYGTSWWTEDLYCG